MRTACIGGRAFLCGLLAALLAGCEPAGDAYQSGTGYGGPPAGSPVATPDEINRYLSDGLVDIVHYDVSPLEGAEECGYFASNGGYDAYAMDWSGLDSWFRGSWWVRGSELCIDGQWDIAGFTHVGCNLVEWSRDDTLLLIDRSDQVVAELTAYDGPREYVQRRCGTR